MAPAGFVQWVAFFVIQKVLLPEDPALAKTVE
jgi:hypothetical protein